MGLVCDRSIQAAGHKPATYSLHGGSTDAERLGDLLVVRPGRHLQEDPGSRDEGRILVNRLEGMNFWFLPGGVVEIGEATEVALARELTEELTVASEIGRLLWGIAP